MIHGELVAAICIMLGGVPGPDVRGAAARPFEELHWVVHVEAGPRGPRLGEITMAEGPAVPRASGSLRVVLRGPRAAPAAELPAAPGQVDLPARPDQAAIALEGPSGPLDERRITRELALHGLLTLALPAGNADTSPAHLARLEHIAKEVEGESEDEEAVHARLESERELCADLRRFDDGTARLMDPHVERQLRPLRPVPPEPLRKALHAWLSGDHAGLAAAWAPWKRHMADCQLWTDPENVTLCRLSARMQTLLATPPPPEPAARLLALEALLLLGRYQKIDR